jgi:hypothetical protein
VSCLAELSSVYGRHCSSPCWGYVDICFCVSFFVDLCEFSFLVAMIIRIHALWERSRVVLTILVVTALAVLAFGAVSFFFCTSLSRIWSI